MSHEANHHFLDFLSTVDTRTCLYLLEALNGDLGKGRTRILVSSRLRLCLPKAGYVVLLENGTVASKGPIDEVKQSGKLNTFFEQVVRDTTNEGKPTSESGTNKGPETRGKDITTSIVDGTSKPVPKRLVDGEHQQQVNRISACAMHYSQVQRTLTVF